jgi:hypothetical protein
MNKPEPSEGAIVSAALKLHADQRSAYLQEACGEDAQLRQRIEARIGELEELQEATQSAPPG